MEVPKVSYQIKFEDILNALSLKKINCKKEILILREKSEKTPSDGRKNAFLTQLYANADMAIQENSMQK